MGAMTGFLKFGIFLILIVAVAYGGYVYGQTSLRENLFEVEVPINQDFSFLLNQEVSLPISQEIEFPINENFPIIDTIPINTIIKVPMNINGQITEVEVPINTSIKVNKTIILNKMIKIIFEKNVTIPINKEVIVPIEGTFKTEIPVPDWMKKS